MIRAGKFIDLGNNASSFIPRNLPVRIKLDEKTINLAITASNELGRLDAAGSLIKNHRLLINPYLRREAVISSRIEGTVVEIKQLFTNELNPKKTALKRNPDIKEVENHVLATERGISLLKEGEEININFIEILHKALLNGVRGSEKELTPGHIRNLQNWIGFKTSKIYEARYVPPPPELVPKLLDNLFNYMKLDSKDNPLIKLGMMHYQFEAVHPFADGNGRIGRLLIMLYMIKFGLLKQPLFYVSDYFEKNKSMYTDLMLRVSNRGDYSSWLKFFLEGVISQARLSSKKIFDLENYLENERPNIREKLGLEGEEIFEQLFKNPYIDINSVSKINKTTFPTAQKLVEKFVKLKILNQISSGRRNKLFIANKIFAIINT